MASEEAKYYNELHGLRCVFANDEGRVSYNPIVFKNNPRVTDSPKEGERVVRIRNFAGNRPYIEKVTPERVYWNYKFKAPYGELWLSKQEKAVGITDAVIIEPYVKNHHIFSQNKAWDIERWKALVKSIDLPWVQLGPASAKALPGVRKINTNTFRDAIPYLNKARLVVTTDGGMHHTRAALGKDAVVLWGGLVPPTMLGYKTHKNLWHGAESCGSLYLCAHCRDAMNEITVEEVRAAVEERLNASDPNEKQAEAAEARS